MGFVLIMDSESATPPQQQDEWEIVGRCSRRRVLDMSKAYLAIYRTCPKRTNEFLFSYHFTIGKEIITLSQMNGKIPVHVMRSKNNPCIIKIKSDKDGRYNLSPSCGSPNSRVRPSFFDSPDNKRLKSTEVDVVEIKTGELTLNVEKAINEYGY
jgi:hypothetical protein